VLENHKQKLVIITVQAKIIIIPVPVQWLSFQFLSVCRSMYTNACLSSSRIILMEMANRMYPCRVSGQELNNLYSMLSVQKAMYIWSRWHTIANFYYTYVVGQIWLKSSCRLGGSDQGDQLIFAFWVIVYVGQFFQLQKKPRY
jgi:hypothetical protein